MLPLLMPFGTGNFDGNDPHTAALGAFLRTPHDAPRIHYDHEDYSSPLTRAIPVVR